MTEGTPSSVEVSPAVDVPAPVAPLYPDLRLENEELRRRLEEQARAFASLRSAVLAASEEDLLRLACAVAERAVGRELTAGPDLLRTWVREASEALASAGDVTIVVAPDLAALLDETLRQSLAAVGAVEVDGSVPSMYCELRCGPSTVPASAGARVAAIAADLGVTE
jgi:transposase-like protein